ncbi:alpha/beta hydrolase [Pseudaminobacter soli (ex Li et al. 2025)]|uniref:Alpha/beta-hydrolase catalytic domain-containing protein n=1 Tax=Pseudaminobacter soli (ex Li et al. 2025) TaxID=1295366 RepID=A0A2P7SG68_9HYPH|nr:alpha/beta-hydrolase family protein [Mesorhizobium soli]PSJ61473.1 hypothetical protein C7I85_10500 [Mesorhizobium soli]
MLQRWLVGLWRSYSAVGLLMGTLFFAASLTPSLLPRTFITQGVLSGVSMAAGYGVGLLCLLLWNYMELPQLQPRTGRTIKIAAAVVCAGIVLLFLWRTTEWQNSIRTLMQLEPVDSANPSKLGLIGLVTFIVLIALARLFQWIYRRAATFTNRFVPRRISNVIGFAIALLLFASVANGVIFRFALHAADSSYKRLDALIEDDIQPPSDPSKTGSRGSLLRWDELGRMGRSYIARGPSKQDIESFLKREAKEPIRVYVGLRSADTAQARAKLALEELKRVGAFERSALVVVTPTGTGWVDPEAADPLEYLHGGDIASVAVQYSYLASWLALLVEPDYGTETSRALFLEVYGYWTTLPKDHRPKLYLYGLSLGALSSTQSSELFEVLGDPYDGALWSGPPFSTSLWRTITDNRNPGSPQWLPLFRDGSYVRFTAQKNALDIPSAHWGPMRVVFLQYASDPITFFEYASAYREPQWMHAPRGPDVSPQLKWFPIVTFLQLGLDMAMATTTPMGYGHVYAPEHYIDAWVAVMDVKWSSEEIERLKQFFRQRQP